jgi:molecular chaperone DnaJ
MTETYYDILGIPETSTQEDIKRAYRKLAIKYHPDKSHSSTADKFNEITKAYETLYPIDSRKEYDNRFEVKNTTNKKVLVGSDLKIAIQVKAIDIVRGLKKAVVIKRKEPCSKCDGTGSVLKKIKKCVYCSGTGYPGFSVLMGQKKKCTYCSGIGHLPDGDKCSNCKGTAQVFKIVRHEIKLDPFSYQFVIPEAGNFPVGKGKAGNLIIDVELDPDPKYAIKGLNISGKLNISPAQAVLGDDIDLKVFDKTICFHIPSGTQDQTIVEQEKCGITYEDKTGVFKALINVIIPNILSEKEKKLYQELLKIEKESPCLTALTF